MFEKLRKLFNIGPSVDFASLIANGALIIDVRTTGEYAGGHIKGSINIPLDSLDAYMAKPDKERPVITVCASGMRSAAARKLLLAKGCKEVHNAGSWRRLEKR